MAAVSNHEAKLRHDQPRFVGPGLSAATIPMLSCPPMRLSPRQSLSFAAHLFKALAKQHHREMLPLLAQVVPEDAVVIDAGAHAGQFTKLLAQLAPRGMIFAFEPGEYARAILRRVVAWRRLDNVTIVAAGLSDVAAKARLSLPIKRSGSLGFGLGHIEQEPGQELNGRAARSETVELTTLDLFSAATGLARLDFIKADIEGWEARMLMGGLKSLRRFGPAILLEVVSGHLARAGSAPDAIWRTLAGFGYRALRLTAQGLQSAPEFSGDGDYLFVLPKHAVDSR